jgi:hypothetical protein
MTAVLTVMLGSGTSAATWAIQQATTLPLLVSVPMGLLGLGTALIAAAVPLASVWWFLDLYRRVQAPLPAA